MPRPSARQRGYTSAWDLARKAYLAKHRVCAMCGKPGADTVDHIVPHRGDMKLFWQRDNWQPMHRGCHSSVKQRDERRGITTGCDESGTPIDTGHHWKAP